MQNISSKLLAKMSSCLCESLGYTFWALTISVLLRLALILLFYVNLLVQGAFTSILPCFADTPIHTCQALTLLGPKITEAFLVIATNHLTLAGPHLIYDSTQIDAVVRGLALVCLDIAQIVLRAAMCVAFLACGWIQITPFRTKRWHVHSTAVLLLLPQPILAHLHLLAQLNLAKLIIFLCVWTKIWLLLRSAVDCFLAHSRLRPLACVVNVRLARILA